MKQKQNNLLKDKNQKEIITNNQIKKEVIDQTNIPLLDKTKI
jgi:hypothetical protein